MGFCVITKIEVINGEIERTPLAFEETESNLSEFENWCNWDNWVEENKIDDNGIIILPENSSSPFCFEGCYSVENIDNINVNLITL